MKLAVLTCGMLPIPAVQGGAVENLIDFYLEYNNEKKIHDITIYSPWDPKVKAHPALSSDVNHYIYIDVKSPKARIERKIYQYLHSNEYYNHFIEYYFEKAYADIKNRDYEYIILENGAGLAYKLSQRGYKNLILHMHNEVRATKSMYHDVIFKSLKKILTVSDFIKERTSALYPIERIQTVHNGIDLNKFSQKRLSTVCRKEIGFSDEDFIMIFSGRINKEKGISELIDAILLLKEFPKIKLMIIGGTFFGNNNNDDGFIHALKNKAKNVEGKILFTGYMAYEKIPEYLQLADVAVIPSIWNDPFPTTVLEAQAMGLPIITTRRGGIPEEVNEKNAILLEANELFVKNLTSAIIDLYQHPEKRIKMSEASIKRSVLFDKTNYAKSFFAAIKDIP